ncbi:MAG: peptidoglycan/xylan/chitin deacetylase (PgdA/CDA1 family) [Cyclobacteriaceae bacterium]|jgi:peptidoglycan/xylan/chitin deacetylase (PgdA/CDA1 family)
MYFFKPTLLQKAIFQNFCWEQKTGENTIYLTFDDGPTPAVTDYVLEQLNQYNAQATFFLLGKNVDVHPALTRKIADRGHGIGNHTYSHLNGWKSDVQNYCTDVERCDEALNKLGLQTKLFRPPYGRIKLSQAKSVMQKKEVIMWSFLTGDFDRNIDLNHALKAVKKVKTGAIIVFHDTQKAFINLKIILPETLSYFTSMGYQFKKLEL